jgi:hypothetical protein
MGEAPRLKPMLSTEILDAAFRLYRSNFATFLGIFAVIYVPMTLLVVSVSAHLLSQGQAALGAAEDALALEAAQRDLQVIEGLVSGVGGILYGLIVVPLATGALTCAVGMRYLNEPATIGSAYRRIFPLFFKYIGTTLLSGLVIGLGTLLCLVPGLMFMTWFFATSSIVCLEGRGGTGAMGRSRELVRGSGWRIFGFLLLTILLQGVLVGPVSVAAELVLPRITDSMALRFTLSTVFQQILGMIVTPFFSAVLVLLYYDLRIRKEAFDLEVLAKNLGVSPPPAAAPAQP